MDQVYNTLTVEVKIENKLCHHNWQESCPIQISSYFNLQYTVDTDKNK